MKGEHVKLFPFLLTSWGEWRKLHPDTLVLKPLPGYAERIPEENRMIREGLSGRGSAPDDVLRTDKRLPPKAMILGLDVSGSNKAFPLAALRQTRVINDKFGGEPDSGGASTRFRYHHGFSGAGKWEDTEIQPGQSGRHRLTDAKHILGGILMDTAFRAVGGNQLRSDSGTGVLVRLVGIPSRHGDL